MEASCFFTSKSSFNKTLNLVPSIRTQPSIFCRKRFGQRLHGFGSPPPPPSSSSVMASCSLRSESPSDDYEPLIESDWRSFRARLVAGEQASAIAPQSVDQIPTPSVLGDKWAHPLYEPEKGCLLIATEKLDGVHIFERTVVLLLSTGPFGPVGIILNRPSLMSIKETRSTDLDIAGTFSNSPLFFGGPLEEGIFLLGPRKGGPNEGVENSGVFEDVMAGLYYGTKESVGCASEMVKRNVVSVDEFRFFDGYCGWGKEQLNDEIRAGYWNVAACSPDVVGLATSVGLWEEVLGLVGERKVM